MSTKKKLSVKERIRRGGPPTKTVPVWLGADLDLIEQYETLRAELENARPAKTLAGDGGRADLEARLESLREQLDDYAFPFKLRGMDDKRWQKLVDKHPPRQLEDGGVDPRDKAGWNAETFPGALVKATTVFPELDDEDWLALLGDDDTEGQLTPAQLDELAAAAYKLSKVPVDVPFWSAVSPSPTSSGRS